MENDRLDVTARAIPSAGDTRFDTKTLANPMVKTPSISKLDAVGVPSRLADAYVNFDVHRSSGKVRTAKMLAKAVTQPNRAPLRIRPPRIRRDFRMEERENEKVTVSGIAFFHLNEKRLVSKPTLNHVVGIRISNNTTKAIHTYAPLILS